MGDPKELPPSFLLSQFAPTGEEAEETLHAIVLGEADALVVHGKDGSAHVYTLKDANEPYRHLIEQISEAALVLEQDGTIIYSNGRLCEMLGYAGGCVGHRFVHLVTPANRRQAEELLSLARGRRGAAEISLNRIDGKVMVVRASAAPMAFDESPRLAMIITALDEISALKASEAALRESEERLLLTQEAAGVGSWELDVACGAAVWSPQCFTLHGLDPATCAPNRASWLSAVHSSDRKGVQTALDVVLASGTAFEIDYRVALPEGRTRWIACRGKVVADAFRRSIRLRGVAIDITELKDAELELRIAKAEAERAVLARSKFLAAASHDLRQPVQSLVLLLDMLKAHPLAPKVDKAVGLMETTLFGLNDLLNSILDISRLDAGVVTPQTQSVDMAALVDRLAREYSVAASGKGLRLRAFQRPLCALTDPALVERMLRNLIENSLRYTPRGGVLLGMRLRDGKVQVDVVDTGVGVAADKLPHIFEEFYQVGNHGRDRRQGLGLGLAIVSRLARLMGAEVNVASREGHGSRFSLLLPLDASARQSVVQPEVLAPERGRILIIEDDDAVRTGMQMLLECWGYETLAAASGEEALSLAASEGWRFDALVADYRLGPGLSGTEAAREIRARAPRPLPTLVITGDTAPERVAEVYASGFKMLHKPVATHELRRTLAQLLKGDVVQRARLS